MPLPRARALPVALVAASLLAASGLANANADDAGFQAATQHFQQAQAGDDHALEAVADEFDALAKAQPGDPLLLAYAGTTGAMRARTTMLPWKKLSFADDGIAQADKALAMLRPADDARLHRGVPDSVETRFVAASLFLGLPDDTFHRAARGRELLAGVLASPLLAQSPLGFRGAVWLRAGEAAAQAAHPDEARRWYGEVVASNAPQAALAKAQLAGLKP